MKKSIKINNIDVSVKLSKEGDDYISLTDMAKFKDPESTGIVIAHWLSSKYTVQFMGSWEQMFNPNFNVTEFSNIKNEAGSNGYILSSSSWIKKTNAIGIRSSAGRYGGTFAHKDIAFEFATWLSPEFKLYLIKEFQRLKIEENERLALGWDVKRMLTKINYKIHTDAIKESIIVPQKLSIKDSTIVYANEADVLNKALFGMTAKEWRDQNPKLEGNIRDYADVTQLVCLANLENLNAEYIRAGLAQGERLLKLNDSAIVQMQSLIDNKSVKKLENDKFFNNKIMKNTKINFTRGFSLASLMFSVAAFLGLVHMATTTPDVSVDLNSLPVASTTMNVDFGANTSANPVTTANNNQSYSAVLKNCTNGRVVNSLDGWHCDISESEVASSTTDQPAPVITSISPTSAMVGDTIVVTGNNLKGFEGDTNLWIQNVLTGAKGMIVKNDAGGSEGSGQNIKFTLANKYCTVDTSYSGLACPSYLTVTPGNYVIYANPWGSVSNQVLFKVVGSKISIPLGRFLLPDGNYSATIGGTYRIAWNPADFGSSTLTIRLIDESKNCAPGIVGCQNSYIISSGIQNNGTYSWDTTKKMGGSSTGPNSVQVVPGTMYKIGLCKDYTTTNCEDTDGYFTLTASAQPNPPVSSTTGWQTYTNSQYGYSIQYPTGATVMDMYAPRDLVGHDQREISIVGLSDDLNVDAKQNVQYAPCDQGEQITINGIVFIKNDVSSAFESMNNQHRVAEAYCTIGSNGTKYTLTDIGTPSATIMNVINSFKFIN